MRFHLILSKYLSCALLILLAGTAYAVNPPSSNAIQISFVVDKNLPNNTYQAHLVLHNQSTQALVNNTLWFNTAAWPTNVKPGILLHPTGGFYGISGLTILPKQQLIVTVLGKGNVTNRSFTPQGYFFTANNHLVNIKINADNIFSNLNFIPSKSTQQQEHFTPALSSIIPKPVYLKYGQGPFNLNQKTVIIVSTQTPELMPTAVYLQKIIALKTGLLLPIKIANAPQNNSIFLNKIISNPLHEEGYRLTVSANNIIMSANTATGIFYGTQTLRQLLQPFFLKSLNTSSTLWRLPSVQIVDYPRYSYRGLHLDVARHFFTIEEIKRLLDLMAMNKLNTFHWHLTDDEGWRIQIKTYPALTQIGAWRGFTQALAPAFGSGYSRYGGFYTQDQIRDVIAYANNLHITVVPEIDMPGHARAMIKSLPQLIDSQDHSNYASVQGYHDNVLSPCIEETYETIDQIIGEISQLFPNNYIHIGGDEVPKGVWEKSPHCEQLKNKYQLHDSTDLASYFVKRIQMVINKHGKNLAGWQEVADGLSHANNQLIYVWSDEVSIKDLLQKGFDLVLMPGSHLYFDLAYNDAPCEIGYHWAGYVDMQKVYGYEPDLRNMNNQQLQHVRGIEGALWSENLDSVALLDYMAFPRMAALAEIAWSPREARNWQDFSARLNQYYLPELDKLHVNYRHEPSQLCK